MDPFGHNAPLSVSFLERAYRRRQLDCGVVELTENVMEDYPESWFDAVPALREACGAYDMDSWLTLIEKASDLKSLVCLYGGKVRTNVGNIKNLYEWTLRPAFNRPTIEFRQHAGTMQPKPIMAWIDFATSLVRLCKKEGEPTRQSILSSQSLMRKPEATFLDLCSVVGCKPETVEYYKNQLAGLNAQNLRHLERLQARQAANDSLAAVALHNVDDQRRTITPENVDERIALKMKMAGYGQFPREFLNAIISSAPEPLKEKLTVGYRMRPEGQGSAHENTFFDIDDARPSSFGSEKTCYSDASELARKRYRPGKWTE